MISPKLLHLAIDFSNSEKGHSKLFLYRLSWLLGCKQSTHKHPHQDLRNVYPIYTKQSSAARREKRNTFLPRQLYSQSVV